MKNALRRCDAVIKGAENLLVGSGVLAITAITFWNVVMRYVFNHSIMWAEELSRYIMIWITFVGANLCIRNNIHVKMDVVQVKLPFRMAKIVIGIVYAICAGGCVFLAVMGVRLTMNVSANNQISTAMPFLKMWLVYVSVPVFAILSVKDYLWLAYLNAVRRDEIVREIGCGDNPRRERDEK